MSSMLRAGHGLMLIVITLLTFGVVMVTSAGLTVGPDREVILQDVLLGRTTLLAALAVGSMILGSYVPVQRFFYRAEGLRSPVPWIIFAIFALLLIVHLPGI